MGSGRKFEDMQRTGANPLAPAGAAYRETPTGRDSDVAVAHGVRECADGAGLHSAALDPGEAAVILACRVTAAATSRRTGPRLDVARAAAMPSNTAAARGIVAAT
ncbi:MAG TPA: hypothetical protein VHT91_31935 [Kofleriaceae bacterium]|jgi:hypothetical protein|nr:hypothetical protein [Kofleriaceae bacterium]